MTEQANACAEEALVNGAPTPAEDHAQMERWIFLTDITLESLDAPNESDSAYPNLNGLWVYKNGDLEQGQQFTLERTTGSTEPVKWQMGGHIELSSLGAVEITLKDEHSEDIWHGTLNYATILAESETPARTLDKSCVVDQKLESVRGRHINISSTVHVLTLEEVPDMLVKLGLEDYKRFSRSQILLDIDRVVSLIQRSLDLTPDGHFQLVRRLNIHGTALHARAKLLGNLSDITAAISSKRRALDLIENDTPEMAWIPSSLAESLYARFALADDLSDLTEAISFEQRSLRLVPEGHPELALRLINLGGRHFAHFKRTGMVSDLTEAITTIQRALDLLSECEGERLRSLGVLALFVELRSNVARDPLDLKKAISIHQEILRNTPEGHSDILVRLDKLGDLSCRLFEQTNVASALAEAIKSQQRALALTPDGDGAMARRLQGMGRSLHLRFKSSGDRSSLDEAIAFHRRVLELTADEHPELSERLSSLGNSLHERFQRVGDLADITEVISVTHRALEFLPDGHPNLATITANLGSSYHLRFNHTGDLSDIAKAIELREKALELTPEGDTDLATRYDDLGGSLVSRFNRTGVLRDLTQAVYFHRKALEATPASHPILHKVLSNLGGALFTQFKRVGELSDLEEATSLMQRSLELVPEGHPELPLSYSNLATAQFHRFKRVGNISTLKDAITSQRKAVDLTPDDHPNLGNELASLGAYLTNRFYETGALTELTEAVSTLRKALLITPDGHTKVANRTSDLGQALVSRFKGTGDMADLEEGISLLRRALLLLPKDHSDLAVGNDNLATALHIRFERTGRSSDVTEAIACQKSALELTPDGHPAQASQLGSLGALLYSRYKHSGDLEDLTQSIAMHRRAVKCTPEGHPDLFKRLGDFGNAFSMRFKRTGNLSDLAEGILLTQKSQLLIPEGHPDLPISLDNLARFFFSRFEHTGNFADLSEAIALQEKAVKLTPEDHPGLPGRLGSLGKSLFARFERTDDLPHLMDSIALHTKALGLTPDDHPDMIHRLTALASSLHRRFQRVEDLADIMEVVSLARRCLEILPASHPDRPSALGNLGWSLFTRFNHTSEFSDLQEAVSLTQMALEITPSNHPASTARMISFGKVLIGRYTSPSGSPDDLSKAFSLFKSAATSRDVRLYTDKLHAATLWASQLQKHFPGSPELIQAFDTAMDAISLIAGLENTVSSRFANLLNASGVARDAASAALAIGRMDKALEWLEQGRCLVWGQLNNLRAPLDQLKRHDSELAQAILDVHRRLDSVASSRRHSKDGGSLLEKVSLEEEARSHLDLARERDELIARARRIPGLEAFLLPLPYADLVRHIPATGYVVVINAHKDRFDALVLSSELNQPLHVPLPTMSLDKAKTLRNSLKSCFESHHLRLRDQVAIGLPLPDDDSGTRGVRKARPVKDPMANLLKALWINIVKPIFDVLELKKFDIQAGKAPPRLWWCPTGALSFLPIHAAGVYNDEGFVSAFDYVVPSYTPSITSLATRVGNQRPVSKGASGLFMTSQPDHPTRNFPPIPGTTDEVRLLYARATEERVRALKLEGQEVTVEGCLKYMERFSSVHLACHASQNATNPLQSRFLFHDGSLELRTIIKQSLNNADLAFLSACQTSTGEEMLPDEAVHLAAGMLAAGYRRVVATMWSIGDKQAPQVAKDFYDYLFDHAEGAGMGEFDASLSAEALHFAVQRLRSRLDNSDSSLLAWAPYVHWGY